MRRISLDKRHKHCTQCRGKLGPNDHGYCRRCGHAGNALYPEQEEHKDREDHRTPALRHRSPVALLRQTQATSEYSHRRTKDESLRRECCWQRLQQYMREYGSDLPPVAYGTHSIMTILS